MAAKKTYTEAALRQYLGHLTQEKYFEHLPSNAEIRMDLHKNNRNLTPEKGETKKEILKHYHKRKKELYCMKRDDVVTALEWTCTAPAELTEEERYLFFDETLHYLEDAYGKENIICSFVHTNEGIRDQDGTVLYGHWHMHTMIIPTVEVKDKNPAHKMSQYKEKICNNELVTMKHLKNWHKNYQAHLDTHLPFKAQVDKGGRAANGKSRSVKEIKLETKLEIERSKNIEIEKKLEVEIKKNIEAERKISELETKLQERTLDNDRWTISRDTSKEIERSRW